MSTRSPKRKQFPKHICHQVMWKFFVRILSISEYSFNCLCPNYPCLLVYYTKQQSLPKTHTHIGCMHAPLAVTSCTCSHHRRWCIYTKFHCMRHFEWLLLLSANYFYLKYGQFDKLCEILVISEFNFKILIIFIKKNLKINNIYPIKDCPFTIFFFTNLL